MEKSNRTRLFLISFAALFFEILMIRWISCEIAVFGYFKNLILMGAFVGLGLGCAGGSNAQKGMITLSSFFPYLMAIMVALLAGAEELGLIHINFVLHTDTYYWLAHADVVQSVGQLLINAFWVIGIFFLIVSIFDALGQILGQELAKHESLKAYMANLGGSLLGVVVYSLLAYLKTSPFVWLLVGFASLAVFYRKPPQIVAMIACLVITFVYGINVHWSPYFRIRPTELIAEPARSGGLQDPTHLYIANVDPNIKPFKVGWTLNVNHAPYQHTIDLSDGFLKEHPELKQTSEYSTYNLPYWVKREFTKSPEIKDALVLGAGSGNDVAAALRNGSGHVDAVEIDPTIVDVGGTKHPEHPYEDPRVTPHINDARNFIASTDKKYDVIAFGFVDSHVSFSMLSSVRLDNFLYTVESLTLIGSRLKPDGIAALSFAAGPDWLKARLYQMVQKASGQEPIALHSCMMNPNSIIIIWGPGLTEQVRNRVLTRYKDTVIPASELNIPVITCTDDWPFLYQRARVLTPEYGCMLAMLILIAGSLTVVRFRLNWKSFITHAQFFLLGAGFLLMETRAMLAVAVLFGSTWIVNSVVISLILAVAMLSNAIISRFRSFNPYIAYTGLFVSLVVLYMIPLSTLVGADMVSKVVAASLIIGLPFGFAGLVFSSAFSRTTEPDKALGINVFGALLGGCLEYLSVITGARDLVLIALALYAFSLAVSVVLRGPSKQSAEEPVL